MAKVSKSRFWRPIACAVIGFGAILFAVTNNSLAQSQASAAGGIYTAAQAERGGTLFQNNCATCHGGSLQGEEDNPSLSGKHFDSRWGGQPLSTLFGFINTQMPLGQAGSLGAQGNADVVAYILQVNGFPAGAAELAPDIKALRAIVIDKKQ